MLGNPEWSVEDPAGRWHPPDCGDIAVLMPVLTHADLLEREFQEDEIPYVLEGGRFYFARAEVSSALTALAAIDNPNDGVSLYGTLHSVFFGISDEELAGAHYDGIPLDYRAGVPPGNPLARPFSVLRELHDSRNRRPPAETMERLLRETGAREALAAQGFQPLANLAKLVRRLRSIQTGRTFSETLRLVRSLEAEEGAEGESRLMEERGNAVRIMSVHKSKGLDFRIVIVAGLGSRRLSREGSFLADAHETGSYAVSLRQSDGFFTPGWESLKEKEKERGGAELVRLLYVALTRARDHLVVSLRAKGRHTADGWSFADTRFAPLSGFFSEELRKDAGLLEWIPARLEERRGARPRKISRPESFWTDRLAAERAELQTLIASTPVSRRWTSPSESVAFDDRDPAGGEGPAPRARAVRLGAAFHFLMESVDLHGPADPEGGAREAAARFELDDDSARELADMARITLGCGLIARARAALAEGRRVYRELPYSRPMGDGAADVEEGRIDLLFDDGGKWVLADYKTDPPAGTPREFRVSLLDRYGAQLSAYAAALGAAGVRVAEACLLVARTGEAVGVRLP